MLGGEPYVTFVVEGNGVDFLRGKTLLDAKVLKFPSSLGVFLHSTTQSTAVGSNPHGAMAISSETDNIVTHQALRHVVGHLKGLKDDIVVANLQGENAIGGTCPNLAFFVHCNRAHLAVTIMGIALHDILGVQGDIASVLVFAEHIDTSAISGNTDIALTVLYALIGGIVAK